MTTLTAQHLAHEYNLCVQTLGRDPNWMTPSEIAKARRWLARQDKRRERLANERRNEHIRNINAIAHATNKAHSTEGATR